MDDFELELKNGFLEEAAQLLSDVEQCFLSLEQNPGDAALLDKIFRLAHNLKGSAKAVGFDEMGAFAHSFESYLLQVKAGSIPSDSSVISLLLECNDFLNQSVAALKADLNAKLDASSLLSRLHAPAGSSASANHGSNTADTAAPAEEATFPLEAGAPEAEAPPAEGFEQPTAEEAAALMAALTDQHLPSQHMATSAATSALDSSFGPMKVAATTPPTAAAANTADTSIRVSIGRLETLLNFVGELVILQTVLREQVYHDNPTLLRRTVHQLGKVTREVQDVSMGLRLVPIKQNFQKMQRIVRDTATALGKKVQLQLEGEETELDKTVLDAIADPLVHLIRNAVDHGIESAEKRIAAGKPEEGTIVLRAYQQAGKLIIEVKDDGGGINPDVLRAKAVEKGILGRNATISDKEAIHLIFHPGFSTKQQVTDVSGRGVGMDVVKTNIEALQGEVLVDTNLGKGTCFKVQLPLTLAIMEGMIVRCGEERFVIPRAQVFECVKPDRSQVQFNVTMGETLVLREEGIPLVRLGLTLGRGKTVAKAWESIAIIIRSGERPYALLVDDVIGQQQIVVKKLGPELQRLRAFSGSAVLGDGKPALIIEPAEIAGMGKQIASNDWENFGRAAA